MHRLRLEGCSAARCSFDRRLSGFAGILWDTLAGSAGWRSRWHGMDFYLDGFELLTRYRYLTWEGGCCLG
jgi:hypothetical protein